MCDLYFLYYDKDKDFGPLITALRKYSMNWVGHFTVGYCTVTVICITCWLKHASTKVLRELKKMILWWLQYLASWRNSNSPGKWLCPVSQCSAHSSGLHNGYINRGMLCCDLLAYPLAWSWLKRKHNIERGCERLSGIRHLQCYAT